MSEAGRLAPALLLSMPQLNDPNFAGTVVLLCEHNEDGAFGLVINRPVQTAARVLSDGGLNLESEQEIEVWVGGPVEPERSWILTDAGSADDEAVCVCDGVYLSTSSTLLKQILDGPADPRRRLVAGYAGWGPGQLDEELSASSWLVLGVQLDLVFETGADQIWERAIRRLGATPGSLQMSSDGVH